MCGQGVSQVCRDRSVAKVSQVPPNVAGISARKGGAGAQAEARGGPCGAPPWRPHGGPRGGARGPVRWLARMDQGTSTSWVASSVAIPSQVFGLPRDAPRFPGRCNFRFLGVHDPINQPVNTAP